MAVPRPSKEDILNRIATKIQTQTPLVANQDGSVIKTIVSIVSDEFDAIWSAFEDLELQSDPTTATGSDLDNFGLRFGIVRRKAYAATTVGQTPAVRFTNVGSIQINLPSGVRVFRASSPQIAFFTNAGMTINPGQSVDVDVTAANTGEIYNVAIGQLDSSNAPYSSVVVTNVLPIENGSGEESDDSYRQRIITGIRRINVVTSDTISSLARGVPGVRDVLMLEKSRGAGTFDLIVLPYVYTSTNNIVQSVNGIVSPVIPVGISALIKGPRYRQLDIQITLTLNPNTGTSADTIRETIKTLITAKIDAVPIEDGTNSANFNTSQIQATALGADPNVQDAVVSLGMDGSPIATSGYIQLSLGDKLVIRSLTVQ